MARRIDITDESGASIIELVLVVPIMLLLACALLDFAMMLTVSSQANTAAESAARTLLVKPDASNDELLEAAKSAVPAADSSNVSVSVSAGAKAATSYTHHFPSGTNRTSTVTTQPETVSVTVERKWTTLIGKALNGSDSYHAEASSTVNVDRTDGSNW